MGVARHRRFQMLLGNRKQRLEEFQELRLDRQHLVAQIHAHIHSDLVVAAAAGVELFADVADLFREQDFHVHVDVFVGWVEVHLASFDLLENLAKTCHQRGCFFLRDDADIAEHRRVGDGALNVPIIQFLVKADGGMKILHQLVAVL